MSGWHLWAMIPAISVLTLFYLALGNVGYWNYTINEWLLDNGIVALGIGVVYLGEGIYKRCKK